MVEHAIQEVARSTIDVALEGVLIDIVDRHVRLTDAIVVQAKNNPQFEKKT